MKTRCTYPHLLLSSVLAATGTMVAQVHYDGGTPWSKRADSGPDAEVPGWYYNLGLTGIRAELVAEEPKALLVKYVLPKTPARKGIEIGDETFYYQPNRDNSGYDSSARMTASCVVAFIYTIPKRNLAITGRTSP